jgi:hypothetical protein
MKPKDLKFKKIRHKPHPQNLQKNLNIKIRMKDSLKKEELHNIGCNQCCAQVFKGKSGYQLWYEPRY